MGKNRRRSSGKKRIERPCTYDLGYVRQDLYSCRQCTKAASGVLSGFCRGCKETCHADHVVEVIELYTKRHFRCDCGNTRAKNKCVLCPEKDDLNIGNERCYGHNFRGKYCRCNRDYDYMLAMAQCALCEDWFHEDCFKGDFLERGGAEEYELTCRECVEMLPVLADYYDLLNAWRKKGAKASATRRVGCIKPPTSTGGHKPGARDLIWRPGFRMQLCQCNDCMEIYDAAKMLFIVDRSDLVGGPEQDDSSLLKATDDAEIIQDVLDADEDEPSVKRRKAEERIPRKPLAEKSEGVGGVSDGKCSVAEVIMIRRRINDFLRESIQSHSGGDKLNPDSVLSYLADLKKDMLNTFESRLQA